MANQRIWAPWRLRYVKDANKSSECVFCTKPELGDDREALIVHRGERCFVILNLYPYTSGHLMVMPFEHLGRLQDIDPEITAEMMDLAQQAMRRMEEVYSPEGFNVGLNQGRVAGAGVEGHIHLHVVPRWAGDNNYMPVLADTRVMPQSLEESYDALEGGFT
ncbi:MAG: HIT domain-containing protein [Solirubrobacterales bacterium]